MAAKTEVVRFTKPVKTDRLFYCNQCARYTNAPLAMYKRRLIMAWRPPVLLYYVCPECKYPVL